MAWTFLRYGHLHSKSLDGQGPREFDLGTVQLMRKVFPCNNHAHFNSYDSNLKKDSGGNAMMLNRGNGKRIRMLFSYDRDLMLVKLSRIKSLVIKSCVWNYETWKSYKGG